MSFLAVGVLTFAGSLSGTTSDESHMCNICPGADRFNTGSCKFDWSAIIGKVKTREEKKVQNENEFEGVSGR